MAEVPSAHLFGPAALSTSFDERCIEHETIELWTAAGDHQWMSAHSSCDWLYAEDQSSVFRPWCTQWDSAAMPQLPWIVTGCSQWTNCHRERSTVRRKLKTKIVTDRHGQENVGGEHGRMRFNRESERQLILENLQFKQRRANDALDQALQCGCDIGVEIALKAAKERMAEGKTIRDGLEAVAYLASILDQCEEREPVRSYVRAARRLCRDVVIWRTQSCCQVGDERAFVRELERANGGPFQSNDLNSILGHSYSMTVGNVFSNHFMTKARHQALRRGGLRERRDDTTNTVYQNMMQIVGEELNISRLRFGWSVGW